MELPYDVWISRIFDRPPGPEPWTWTTGVEDLPPWQTVAHITRLFERCGKDLSRFDNTQIGEGLWYLVSCGSSDLMSLVYDRAIPWGDRSGCIRSIIHLYRNCFATRCADGSNRGDDANDPLGSTCYMFWDLLRFGGMDDTSKEELAAVDNEFMNVMASALDIEHFACQESALHGLGHWQVTYPERVTAVIDDWLAKHPDAPSELREYARQARTGDVQ